MAVRGNDAGIERTIEGGGMSLEWRVLQLGKQSGAFNTILDEVILETVSNREVSPTIIVNEWLPTVSLGGLQSQEQDVHTEACKKYGIEIVRRSSGGKAVYVHEGYIVFSVIGTRELFPQDLTRLQEYVCHVPEEVLRSMHIPVQFYPPDNLVIRTPARIRTIGNAGQMVKPRGVIVHGSIRYTMNHMNEFFDVLKVEGRKIHQYRAEIMDVLASVDEYAPDLKKEVMEQALIDAFVKKFGGTAYAGKLTEQERTETVQRVQQMQLKDAPYHISKGICYLYVGKTNLVPALYGLKQKEAPHVQPHLG